jgi:hypothetical protein
VLDAEDTHLREKDSGELHLVHAAADCLLAFGALLGLIEDTEGVTLGKGGGRWGLNGKK